MFAHPQAEYQCPYLGQVEQIHGGGESISQHLLGPHAPNFWRFLRHIGTLLDYLGGVCTPTGRVSVSISWPGQANTWGSGGVNISASIRAPCPKLLWRFVRHIGTFQTTWEVLAHPWEEHQCPNLGQVEIIHVGVGKSISQHLLGPHAPNIFVGCRDT